jgi:hypothetical protein
VRLRDLIVFVQIGQQLANFRGARELAGAEVAHEVQNKRLIAIGQRQSRHGFQGVCRTDVGLRHVPTGEQRFELAAKCFVD